MQYLLGFLQVVLRLVDIFVPHVDCSQYFECFAHLGAILPVHFLLYLLDFVKLLDGLLELFSFE